MAAICHSGPITVIPAIEQLFGKKMYAKLQNDISKNLINRKITSVSIVYILSSPLMRPIIINYVAIVVKILLGD